MWFENAGRKKKKVQRGNGLEDHAEKRKKQRRERNGETASREMEHVQRPQYSCHAEDKWQWRLSDKTAHIKAVRRNKSGVTAYPGVAESLP